MELNSTWSPSTREESYGLQTRGNHPQPGSSRGDGRSAPAGFLSGPHSQTSLSPPSSPEKDSRLNAPTLTCCRRTHRLPESTPLASWSSPQNGRFSFSNESVTRGSLPDCPSLPLLHATPSTARQSDLKNV